MSPAAPAERARVVVLISGRGSNLQALIAASDAAQAAFEVVGVLADRPAAGIQHALGAGVPATVIDRQTHADRASFEAALSAAIAALRPDWIVLAGFMRVLSAAFVARHADRMLNIHPSLLPRYPGLDTHARALAAGDAWHGASVHLVTAELDGGPVLAQARVPIAPASTAGSLAEDLLPLEHRLLTACVQALACGWVQVQAGAFRIDGHEHVTPLLLDASGALHRAGPDRAGRSDPLCDGG